MFLLTVLSLFAFRRSEMNQTPVHAATEVATAHGYVVHTWLCTAGMSGLKIPAQGASSTPAHCFGSQHLWKGEFAIRTLKSHLLCTRNTRLQVVFCVHSLGFNVSVLSREVCTQIIVQDSLFLGTDWLILADVGQSATGRAQQELRHPGFCFEEGTTGLNPAKAKKRCSSLPEPGRN